MKKGSTINLKHGPRFSGTFSTLGGAMTVLGGIGAMINMTSGDIGGGLFFLFFGILAAPIFLDFRGVNIDFSAKRIQQYRSYFGIRSGKWESFEDFDKVTLIWGRNRGRSTASMLTGSRRASSSDSYYVLLEGDEETVPFEIGEYSTHKAAKKMMNEMASRGSFPSVDSYAERLESAQERRDKYESRRR